MHDPEKLTSKGFLFGYDSGIITSTIAQPHFVTYFNKPNDNVVGGIVSSFQGGAILGTIITFFTADKLGRKKTIALGALIATIGCALQAGAVNMAMLIIGRFIAGVAVGILTSTIPMYASEIAEPKYRGALSGLLQWMLSWGFFVAQWLGYGCSFNKGPFQCKFIKHLVHSNLNFYLITDRAFPTCFPMCSCYYSARRNLVPPRISALAHGARSTRRSSCCPQQATRQLCRYQ